MIKRELNLESHIFQSKRFYIISSKKVDNDKDVLMEIKELQKMNIEQYIDGDLCMYQKK